MSHVSLKVIYDILSSLIFILTFFRCVVLFYCVLGIKLQC